MKLKKQFFIVLIGLFCLTAKACSQASKEAHYEFSFRYSFNYNFDANHHSPAVSIKYKTHNFYFGPEITTIKNALDEKDHLSFDSRILGFNLGYRKYFFSNPKLKIRYFGQINFSIYPYKTNEYNIFRNGSITEKKTIFENTGTLGIEYNFTGYYYLFFGAGIGSTKNLFFTFRNPINCIYMGIEYEF